MLILVKEVNFSDSQEDENLIIINTDAIIKAEVARDAENGKPLWIDLTLRGFSESLNIEGKDLKKFLREVNS